MNGDGKIGLPDPGQCGEDGKDIKARDGDEVPSADGEGDDVSDDEESMDCYEALVLMKSRVLLVENDDSTRYVIGALLRNCGYQVTETSNGLQAWRILKDTSNHIDLVLTEVNLPRLSVMSTHDSGALVLKCLSKGATDFLVKPVRKNELKFLWQHIWRRRQNNGFPCGSKGDTQDLKPKSDGDSNFQPQQQ
ncbi:two-component response regulator-like APRR7 isoform X2 [Vitis vinifera]|uniref:two-component response regulator-like APRR7 isoform X2 n=1 Tax=Vitis vinifera TaxID=29760 RepID=UPI00053FA43E|nr:two-component response regulator-like APRR7 isoform X2 [Vitis vinifera]|eukprot:XP_010653461.1 PREDICTED: two-component response regulator-like APRR7 isoform X2 [Vitis vinifera]